MWIFLPSGKLTDPPQCHYNQSSTSKVDSVRIPHAKTPRSETSFYSPDSNAEAGPSSQPTWPISPAFQPPGITSFMNIPPAPEELLPYFPLTEQRFLFHHYLKESVHNFLILPAPALGNPWVTLHCRLALRSPPGTNIFEEALRKAIFAFASFEIGYRISGSGFLLDDSGQPQENSFVLQSRTQREESLNLLTQALSPGKSTADDFDTAIAACLSLITLDVSHSAVEADLYRDSRLARTGRDRSVWQFHSLPSAADRNHS